MTLCVAFIIVEGLALALAVAIWRDIFRQRKQARDRIERRLRQGGAE